MLRMTASGLCLRMLIIPLVVAQEQPARVGIRKQRALAKRAVKQGHDPLQQLAACQQPSGSAQPSVHTRYKRPPSRRGSSRCVYVDIGANHADTFDLFTVGFDESKIYHGRPKKWNWHWNDAASFPVEDAADTPCPHQQNRGNVDIYAVEANPMHDSVLVDRFCRFPQLRGLYNRTAIWNATTSVSRGGIKFYLDLVNGNENTWPFAWSASTNPNSDAIRRSGGKHLIVPTLDVCELLLQEIEATPENRVVVKLDVEEADDVVLRRILSMPACRAVIDVIAWEDASRKPTKRTAESNRLEAELKGAGIVVRGWY